MRASRRTLLGILPWPLGSRTLKAEKGFNFQPQQSFHTFEDDVFGVGTVELLGQHVQEGGEVKGAWGLGHHLVDVTVVDVADTKGHVAEE